MAGTILNVRGAPGSGKTEFARRVLEAYGWRRGQPALSGLLPGYRFAHPAGARPLAVIGCYGRTSGGSDTITLRDGGVPAALETAARLSSDGCDVLFEGLALSEEHARTFRLAQVRPLHVLHLTTPPDRCGVHLSRRRRRPASEAPALAARAADHAARIATAVETLRPVASVHEGAFDLLLERASAILGLDTALSAAA